MFKGASIWTPEMLAALKPLWESGLSARQCAKLLNDEFRCAVSRNAVIGKVHRCRLAGGLTMKRAAPAQRKRIAREDGRSRPYAPKPRQKYSAVSCAPLFAGRGGFETRPCDLPRWPFESGGLAAPAAGRGGFETRPCDLPPWPFGDAPPEQRKQLLELEPTSCRWPTGDPKQPGFFFCGAIAIESLPYCWRCAAIAYDFSRRRRSLTSRSTARYFAGARA